MKRHRKWIASFLAFHGYGEAAGDLEAGLRAFQARNGAPVTGKLNHQTCRLLNAMRCAHPERMVPPAADEARFLASSFQPARLTWVQGGVEPEIDVSLPPEGHLFEPVYCRWTRRSLRYSLVGAAPAHLGDAAWDAVRSAFGTWDGTGAVSLREALHPDPAEIRVLWTPGPGSDPASIDPFYGPGGTVAVGYYPLPHYEGDLAGDLHLDLSERWSLGGEAGTLDVQTVVLHEIGHCLGIGHCADTTSVMYALYKQRQRTLDPIDVAELARRYETAPW